MHAFWRALESQVANEFFLDRMDRVFRKINLDAVRLTVPMHNSHNGHVFFLVFCGQGSVAKNMRQYTLC